MGRSAPASAPAHPAAAQTAEVLKPKAPDPEPAPRRSARIVQLVKGDADDRERLRLRLLDRLMTAETRGSISRAADEYVQGGFAFPIEQPVQLQLLEHFDETRAREAITALAGLFAKEPPLKRPILEQRLRRLEEYADEATTREAAAELRRALRA